MSTEYTVRRRVNAPIEVVWETLTDIERMPEWTPSTLRVRYVAGHEIAEGAQIAIRQPRLRAATWLVDRVEPGRRFTWSSVSGGVKTTGDHELTPQQRADNGQQETEVKLSIRHEGRGARLVGALTSRLTRRYLLWEITGLAERAEQSLPPAAP